MNRPFILRLLPERARLSFWSRYYRGNAKQWLPLYESAPIDYAPAKMDLVPGDAISDCIAFTGLYERAFTKRLAKAARRGGLLIDVGANLGYFSLLWLASNPANECIAFEASPRIVPILRRNIAQNGFEARIRVIPLAAGHKPGRVPFELGPAEQSGWGGLLLEKTGESIEVDVVRIDDVVPSDRPIALLKVDTEGADTWALMGAERLLKCGAVQEVWFEQNKPRMEDLGIAPDAAREYLTSVGYTSRPAGDTRREVTEWQAMRAGMGA